MLKPINLPDPPNPPYPRYTKNIFPPYRYISGVNPHPLEDPAGHSYGKPASFVNDFWAPEAWGENEIYLFGVDLYNYAFWWKAHESFESLWQSVRDDDIAKIFFKI